MTMIEWMRWLWRTPMRLRRLWWTPMRLRQAVRAAVSDTSVSAIVLMIDSPGGTVAGTDDRDGSAGGDGVRTVSTPAIRGVTRTNA
jgi:hypothetical protein